jgi:hypothetical protein
MWNGENHGSRLRWFPGSRAPIERFQGVLSAPWTSLNFSLTFKPLPHNYSLINISRYSFGPRTTFCWMFIVFLNASRLCTFYRYWSWLSCICRFCFGKGDSWNSGAAEANEHPVAPLRSFLVFLVPTLFRRLRFESFEIVYRGNLNTPWNSEKLASMVRIYGDFYLMFWSL